MVVTEAECRTRAAPCTSSECAVHQDIASDLKSSVFHTPGDESATPESPRTIDPILSTNSSNVEDVSARDRHNAHGVRPGASAEENYDDLTPEKERQLREMYERLDSDNDGILDLCDLTHALTHTVPHIPTGYAQRLLKKMSLASDKATFPDFVRYATRQERKLEKVFRDLDRDRDGRIDVQDFQRWSYKLGVPLDNARADFIVQQMGADDSDCVDLLKFQKFMLLYPSSDPRELAKFWGHKLVIDIGEDSLVPSDFSLEELASGVWWRHLIAGGVAGAISRTCTAPFDRIKVYLQVNSNKNNHLTLWKTVKILHEEGRFKSFWRGNGINVAKIAPESAIKFMVYEQAKRWIQEQKGSPSLEIYERVVAGSAAGAISQTSIYPLEVLKTRLALRRTGQLDKGLVHFAYKLYKREGLGCFYRGYVPNLLGIMPYAGIDLAVYETLKGAYLTRNEKVKEPGVLALLTCGTISCTCGQLASYPLSLVRTRLQARTWSCDQSQPDTMVGQFRYIIQSEGFAGLYRGIAPNFLKVIPAVSISYVVYETVRQRLGVRMS